MGGELKVRKILDKIDKIQLQFLTLVPPALAQPPKITPIKIPTPEGGPKGEIGDWVQSLVNWSIALTAILTLGYIIWGGVDYVMAGDDAKRVEAARGKITNGVIGLIIVASAFIFFRLLIRVLDLERIFPK